MKTHNGQSMIIQVRPTQVNDLAFVLRAEHDPANASFVEHSSSNRPLSSIALIACG
jgi:hypothetical protein